VLVTMTHVEIKENKGDEFVEAMKMLIDRFRRAKGCIGYRLNRDLENENAYELIGEWQSLEDCERHLSSPDFEVLQGAITVLGKTSQTQIMNLEKEGKKSRKGGMLMK
jgi:quinol monooxygenase YgiN